MAASYPNAKKTFSQIVDGTTKVAAANVNTNYDETEAIETMLGAMGCTSQAHTESFKNLLLDYQSGCTCTYSSATEITVAVGKIAIPDASGNLKFRRNTSAVTVTWAMIDTGSEAASTQYYLYAVADSAATTFTVKISTNATTPSGCTFYRKIGWFYNNASSNIQDVVTYNSFMGRMVCDTGWFAQTADTTVNHNFGTMKFLCQAFFADNSDGTGTNGIPGTFGTIASNGYGITLDTMTPTSCNIQVGGGGIGGLDGNGTAMALASGYYVRVILEAIA